MNAVILDIQGEFAAALRDDGVVEKIPNNSYDIGQPIELYANVKMLCRESHQRTKRFGRIGVVAAMFALAVCMATGIAYATPYGTVSLDANASLEYTINCFNFVIDVKALDENGNAVLENMDNSLFLNKKISTAVSVILEQSDSEESLDGDTELTISVGTRGEFHSEKLAKRLKRIEKQDITSNVHVVPFMANDEKTAHKGDMTVGKDWKSNNDVNAPVGEEKNDGVVPNNNDTQIWESGYEEIAEDNGNTVADQSADLGTQPSGNTIEIVNGTDSQDARDTSSDSNIQSVWQSDSDSPDTMADADDAIEAVKPNNEIVQDVGTLSEAQEDKGDIAADQTIPAEPEEASTGQDSSVPVSEDGN